MKKATKIFPFILAIGYIIFLVISGYDKLNALKVFGLSLGLLVAFYSIFMILAEKYVDVRDGFKLKKIRR